MKSLIALVTAASDSFLCEGESHGAGGRVHSHLDQKEKSQRGLRPNRESLCGFRFRHWCLCLSTKQSLLC